MIFPFLFVVVSHTFDNKNVLICNKAVIKNKYINSYVQMDVWVFLQYCSFTLLLVIA